MPDRSAGMINTRDISLPAAGLPPVPDTKNWRDVFYTARDGLRLYARHYPAPGSTRRPVLCLAGLTRNTRDFHEIASVLSSPTLASARDVFALDYRGRGRSQHDPDWRNYSIPVELGDVLDFMTLSGLHDAAVIGTSRGGLIAMVLAAIRPTSLGAVVLNDIGPVIEREGLLRIIAYVGRIPLPGTWEEAAQLVRSMNEKQFPAVPDHLWVEVAHQIFDDANGKPAHSYDQHLNRSISALDGPIPELWPQFAALSRMPTMVLRGEFSDILSLATCQRMLREHPHLSALTVAGQGHAPLLRDQASILAIVDFLDRCDNPHR